MQFGTLIIFGCKFKHCNNGTKNSLSQMGSWNWTFARQGLWQGASSGLVNKPNCRILAFCNPDSLDQIDSSFQKASYSFRRTNIFNPYKHGWDFHLNELGIPPVWSEKIARCLLKLPKNDGTRKMIDFNIFTKIAQECGRFGQMHCCQRL